MSLIDKNNLTYLTAVERFFLSLKGSGQSLSASDYHLISQWEERAVPVSVLCRAIERGFSRIPMDNRSRFRKISLAYLKDFIEREIGATEP